MMNSNCIAIDTSESIPKHNPNVYSNRVLQHSHHDHQTIKIRIIENSSSNNVVRIIPTIEPKGGTSNKVDNKAISEFVRTIASYKFLEDNWDGYGGVKFSSNTIEDAIKLIKLLPLDTLPTRVGASSDGEISIIWDKEDLFADFGIMGDGEFCYFIKNKKQKLYGDEISLNDGIPDKAIEQLRK